MKLIFIYGMPAVGKPIVRIIRIRMMVEEKTYRRFHLNFLRIHRQAVMGNERRYFYDYYMLCCGPIALADRVDNPDQAVKALAGDGALIAAVLNAPVARAAATVSWRSSGPSIAATAASRAIYLRKLGRRPKCVYHFA